MTYGNILSFIDPSLAFISTMMSPYWYVHTDIWPD